MVICAERTITILSSRLLSIRCALAALRRLRSNCLLLYTEPLHEWNGNYANTGKNDTNQKNRSEAVIVSVQDGIRLVGILLVHRCSKLRSAHAQHVCRVDTGECVLDDMLHLALEYVLSDGQKDRTGQTLQEYQDARGDGEVGAFEDGLRSNDGLLDAQAYS